MGAGKFTTAWSAADAGVGTFMDWMKGRQIKKQQQQQAQMSQNKLPVYGNAALYGLGGLVGSQLLLSAIPGIKDNSGAKTALSLAAMAGLGYAGWKAAQNARNANYNYA